MVFLKMTLLFYESPIIGGLVLIAMCMSIIYKAPTMVKVISFATLFALLVFYRYDCINLEIEDTTIISPAEGTIIDLDEFENFYYMAIFLNIFNKHYQVYPVNGEVIYRDYDATGKFNLVKNIDKSMYNEKKIHHIKMKDNTIITLIQIAGFVPRAITSDDELCTYKAGEYLGMIKFGSRIDLILPKITPDGKKLIINQNNGDKIKIGDYIGQYTL
jgi:phosphatidylserine decarboxylase